MSKSIYEQAIIYTNDAEWWCDKACYWLGLDISERDQDYDIANKLDEIRKSLHNAQKQEKLLNKIKEIIDIQDDSYISSMLEESKKYYEIKKLIEELENER